MMALIATPISRRTANRDPVNQENFGKNFQATMATTGKATMPVTAMQDNES